MEGERPSDWLTYQEAAEQLGSTAEAVRYRALRGKWPRRRGNDGRARVQIPEDAPPVRTPGAHPVRTPSAPRSDEALTHALESHIKTLQGDNEALKERLAEAEAQFAAAETRIENLLADLADRGAQHADERAVLVAQIAAERANAEKAIAAFAALAERLDALAAANQRTWWDRVKRRLVG